jgi:hypothetical protein
MMDGLQTAGPDLSVILVCPGGRRALHRTLAALASQTIAHRIEIIVASPDGDLDKTEAPLLRRFHSVWIVPDPAITNVDHVVGRLLPQGTAPIVASVEDHAFPDPEWAESLLAAYDDSAVAVGSAVINANPGSMLSWSNILLAYGQWAETVAAGDIAWLPLHNCSYRKSALVALGADIAPMFNREGEVLVRLRDAGGRFRFAPGARIRHLNPSTWKSTWQLRLDAGRLAAANRWRDGGWSRARRFVFAVSGPLIPLVRYLRMRQELFGPSKDVTEHRHGLALLLGLVFDGAGQIAGFVAGPGQSRARLSVFEMDRIRHLNRHDATAFSSQVGPEV